MISALLEAAEVEDAELGQSFNFGNWSQTGDVSYILERPCFQPGQISSLLLERDHLVSTLNGTEKHSRGVGNNLKGLKFDKRVLMEKFEMKKVQLRTL